MAVPTAAPKPIRYGAAVSFSTTAAPASRPATAYDPAARPPARARSSARSTSHTAASTAAFGMPSLIEVPTTPIVVAPPAPISPASKASAVRPRATKPRHRRAMSTASHTATPCGIAQTKVNTRGERFSAAASSTYSASSNG